MYHWHFPLTILTRRSHDVTRKLYLHLLTHVFPFPPMLSVPPYSTTSTPRLQALYSDFSRQKQSNPTSYQSNIEWWRKGLEIIVSSGLQTQHTAEETSKSDRLVLHAGRELLELVKLPKVGKPLALGAVIVRQTKKAIPCRIV